MQQCAVLTDIHANLPAFQAVIADAQARGCTRFYHAGDLISIGPYPAEVVDLARDVHLRTVLGNHEMWVRDGLPLNPTPVLSDEELQHQHWTHSRLNKSQRDYLRALPLVIDETVEDVRLHIVHFALADDELGYQGIGFSASDEETLALFSDIDADLICYGHLHNRRVNQLYQGRHFLNPGSAGCAPHSCAPYALVSIEKGAFTITLHDVPYDRGPLLARYDTLEIPARDTIRKLFFGVN